MSTHTQTRHYCTYTLSHLQPGDVITAVDDQELPRPMTVDGERQLGRHGVVEAVRLIPPDGSVIEWWLYCHAADIWSFTREVEIPCAC